MHPSLSQLESKAGLLPALAERIACAARRGEQRGADTRENIARSERTSSSSCPSPISAIHPMLRESPQFGEPPCRAA